MVGTGTKYLLEQTDYDPKLVARVTNATEQECWEYLGDLNIELSRHAKRREVEIPFLQQELREWVSTIDDAYETKRKVLLEKLRASKDKPGEYDTDRLLSEYRIYTMKQDSATPEEIERARAFPITDLIENRRMMAKCPFHPDKTASLYLKNNFYHCFGCAASGDVIDFVMKTEDLTFLQAIRRLT